MHFYVSRKLLQKMYERHAHQLGSFRFGSNASDAGPLNAAVAVAAAASIGGVPIIAPGIGGGELNYVVGFYWNKYVFVTNINYFLNLIN
jgi:hypothetical protein